MTDMVSVSSLPDAPDSFEHFGVKGMKWGVRKSITSGKIKPRSVVKRDKADNTTKPEGYAESFNGRREKTLTKVYKKAAPKIRKEIRVINKSEAYKDADLKKDSKLRSKYHKEVSEAVERQLNASAALYGYDKRRRHRLVFDYNVDKSVYPKASIKVGSQMSLRKTERQEAREVRRVRHSAETDEETYELTVMYDDMWRITDLNLPELTHILDADDEFEHYGVKGMKWGVRKPRDAGPGPASSAKKGGGVTTTSKKLPDGKTEWHVKDHATGKVARAVTTRGDAAAKAIVERHAQKKISEAVNKSTEAATKPTKKLSDEELKKAIERIELERKYASLTAQPVSPNATDKIRKAMSEGGQQAVKQVTANVAQMVLMAGVNAAVKQVSGGKVNVKAKKKDDKKD